MLTLNEVHALIIELEIRAAAVSSRMLQNFGTRFGATLTREHDVLMEQLSQLYSTRERLMEDDADYTANAA